MEEPLPFSNVEPIMTVFTDQVRVLFGVRTYGVVFRHVPVDNVENYSTLEGFSSLYSSFSPPTRGPVVVPVYFLTGYGWSTSRGVVPAWANYGNPPSYRVLSDLLFGFTIFRSEEHSLYPVLTANRPEVLVALVHEFGHNLGLRDLYRGSVTKGCDSLPVVMAANFNIPRSELNHDSPPRYGGMLHNRTIDISAGLDNDGPLLLQRIEEVYYSNNTLRFVSYTHVTNATSSWTGNASETLHDVAQLRKGWTKEEAAHIGMEGIFPYECPQEFPDG